MSELKKHPKAVLGAFLVVVAIFLGTLFFPVGLVALFWKKRWGQWFFNLAISLDQTLGVMYDTALNGLFFRGDKLGNPDETISSVTGKNKRSGTLTKAGCVLSFFLDKLDPNHSLKSIEDDEKSV